MKIEAFNHNHDLISQVNIVDKYIDEKRWDVLSAAISRLIQEIQEKQADFFYAVINDEKVMIEEVETPRMKLGQHE